MNLRFVANEAYRRLDRMFPGFFPSAKHNHYIDFGFPEKVEFNQCFAMYTRNGIARAAVNKTAQKTWQDAPFLLEKERDGSEGGDTEETALEAEIRTRFADLRVWQRFAEADRRSMVGAYAGVILRFADNKKFDQPVDRVNGGLNGLVEIVPAWEGQLTVSQWDTDETSENYGHPAMFQFNEAQVEKATQNPRSFNVHPDRVVIWSADGTVHGRSSLEPGYNDLMTIEKIVGGGGEGFWKNAKSAPVLEIDKDTQIQLPDGMTEEQYAKALTDQVESWQKGFDKMLMLQGIQAKALSVTLPSPEHFFAIALQSFAASMSIPMKILVGSQTGERASTEDAQEWSQTIMARRNEQTIPNVMAFVARLVKVGILPAKDWFLDWIDLTESSMSEKIDRASKMADTNQKMKDSGEFIFTPEEIRAAVGYEPLSASEAQRDDEDEDDIDASVTPNPKKEDADA